ncbi:MAG: FecR family protein [Gammaproteobacteria bacterium]
MIAALVLCGPGVQAADPPAPAGEVVIARGVVTAYTSGGTARVVGPRSEVFGGEVISTGTRSLALLKLVDGTRITLRPDTTFEITEFDTTENEESALFTLFKGGLRSVTGFLSKRNPDAMRLKTSVATIGIRGTEFDVRLCAADCAAEAARRPAPAGRAGFVKGRVLARAPGGRARTLSAGAPVYSGDTLLSDAGAWAVVAFRDESRVTILPNTEFRVEKLDFEPDKPSRGRAAFRLLRGGLRAVTGLIGKRGYRMHTAVATIGIRGTGYDAICQGTCQNPDPAAGPGGDGLFTEVWDGSITLDEVHVVEAGQVVFLSDRGFTPVPVPALPMELEAPPPNTVDLPPPPPPPPSSSNPEEGLYVSCYAGTCALETDDNLVELEAGEAGHVSAGGGPAAALEEVPPFQAEDPILQAVDLGDTLSTINESLDGGALQCTVR